MNPKFKFVKVYDGGLGLVVRELRPIRSTRRRRKNNQRRKQS